TWTAPLRNGPCSTGPTGSVSRISDTATTSIPTSAESSSIARARLSSRSPRLEPIPTKAVFPTAAIFATLKRLGVMIASGPRALARTALAGAALGRGLEPYQAGLVLAKPGAGPALREAGGERLATALPIWRVPTRPALRVLPGLLSSHLVSEVTPDQPLSTLS